MKSRLVIIERAGCIFWQLFFRWGLIEVPLSQINNNYIALRFQVTLKIKLCGSLLIYTL